jgi:virulence-associated protein VagC
MYFRSSHVRLPVAMRLDVVENAQALLVGGRIVVVPQEPEAPAAILVDQAVDRLSDCV